VTGPNLRTALRRLSWEVRTSVGRFPGLCRLLLRRSGEMATEETEICIEGFQRSGNTFAVIAFGQAQARTVSIAHHVHAAGAVIAAVRLGKPTMLLVRRPEDAVLSAVVRYPHLSVRQALRGYRRFHTPLLRHRDRVVVGRFEDVIEDLGGVIRQVNRRFGTTFQEFVPTADNADRVRVELDRWDSQTFGPGEALEMGRARPTEARERAKDALSTTYREPGLDRLRRKAERLHAAFAGVEGSEPSSY
jgi:hypothetical protein